VIQPIVTPELLKRLDEVFPSRPDRSMAHRDIDIQIGQREVVDYLHGLYEQMEHGTPEFS
jgi:hypothetical protein